MPVYNVAPYIEESINSILQQSYTDFEFIIIDDGSTDGTLEKIYSFQDSRIKVIAHQTNMGLVASLNEGISISSGKYIARMDGDDYSLPRRLERQVSFMEVHPHVGVCGGQALYLGTNQITTKPFAHEDIKCWQLFHCTFVHPSVIIRKSVLETHGIRYLPYIHAEDYEIWNRLAEVTELVNLPDLLVHYRLHAGQVSTLHRIQQDQYAEAIRRNQLRRLGIEPTDEEYQIHMDFALYKIRVHDPVHYSQALAWAHKILEGNVRYQIYDHATLNMVLSKCFSVSDY